MSKTATIVALRDEDLFFVPVGASRITKFKEAPEAWCGPRPALERNPLFRQIIPYVVVTAYDKVLTYARGAAGNEGLLHGLLSIGVGGHVDASDALFFADGSIDVETTAVASALREIEEEIDLKVMASQLQMKGLIRSELSDVDKVHLGLVYTLDITGQEGRLIFEDTMLHAEFLTIEELRERSARLETWSQMALDLL